MCLFKAQHLRAQTEDIGAVRIRRGRRKVVARVDGVYRREIVFGGEHVIETRVSEVFADGLQRAAETSAMPLKSGAPAGGVGHRFRSGRTLGTAFARDAKSGTKAAEVWCRF